MAGSQLVQQKGLDGVHPSLVVASEEQWAAASRTLADQGRGGAEPLSPLLKMLKFLLLTHRNAVIDSSRYHGDRGSAAVSLPVEFGSRAAAYGRATMAYMERERRLMSDTHGMAAAALRRWSPQRE